MPAFSLLNQQERLTFALLEFGEALVSEFKDCCYVDHRPKTKVDLQWFLIHIHRHPVEFNHPCSEFFDTELLFRLPDPEFIHFEIALFLPELQKVGELCPGLSEDGFQFNRRQGSSLCRETENQPASQ